MRLLSLKEFRWFSWGHSRSDKVRTLIKEIWVHLMTAFVQDKITTLVASPRAIYFLSRITEGWQNSVQDFLPLKIVSPFPYLLYSLSRSHLNLCYNAQRRFCIHLCLSPLKQRICFMLFLNPILAALTIQLKTAVWLLKSEKETINWRNGSKGSS